MKASKMFDEEFSRVQKYVDNNKEELEILIAQGKTLSALNIGALNDYGLAKLVVYCMHEASIHGYDLGQRVIEVIATPQKTWQ